MLITAPFVDSSFQNPMRANIATNAYSPDGRSVMCGPISQRWRRELLFRGQSLVCFHTQTRPTTHQAATCPPRFNVGPLITVIAPSR